MDCGSGCCRADHVLFCESDMNRRSREQSMNGLTRVVVLFFVTVVALVKWSVD